MTAELEKQPADKMHKIVFEVSIDGAEKWQGALRNVENVHKSLGYFKENPPRVSWEFVFVLATIAGGFLAAWTGGEFENEWLSPMWTARFGDSIALRAVVARSGAV